MSNPHDLNSCVKAASARGELVVQPRLGVPDAYEMAARIGAVAALPFPVVGTLTVDSYTRVGNVRGSRDALQSGSTLNGFPLIAHSPQMVGRVLSAAQGRIPVQVRHGAADPRGILRAARLNGLLASEGGPVSYCLPYSRMPLQDAVKHWRAAAHSFAEPHELGTPHLETFAGCMLGQLCPPSLLVALSVLEALFFEQCGLQSVSLSYAEQGHRGQDVAALQALRGLARRHLQPTTEWHVVQYGYMGLFPRTRHGANKIIAASAEKAKAGGADRLIVKTVAEAHRLPTLGENIAALELASRTAASTLPETPDIDELAEILEDAGQIITAVRELSDDIGAALVSAFDLGALDVPFCLHPDNPGLARSTVDAQGRVVWSDTGRLPVAEKRTAAPIRSDKLMNMLGRMQTRYDSEHDVHHLAIVGGGPRALAVLERLSAACLMAPHDFPKLHITIFEPYEPGSGRIWRTNQPSELVMNTVCQEVTMFSGPRVGESDEPGAGASLAEWWRENHPASYHGGNGYAPRALYGSYLEYVYRVCSDALDSCASITHIREQVRDIERPQNLGFGWRVRTDDRIVDADTVLLATGHPRAPSIDNPDDLEEPRRRGSLHGDSAADIPLGEILPGESAALLGMGLSFYDLVALLTTARGGEFKESDESLIYSPSGQEPHILGISRSGLPIPARGSNQKQPISTFVARVFKKAHLEDKGLEGSMTLLQAEVAIQYYSALLAEKRCSFLELVDAAQSIETPDDVYRMAAQVLPASPPPPNLFELARPFQGKTFKDPAEWSSTIYRKIAEDSEEAARGNSDSALKSALDVIRDVRGALRWSIETFTAEDRVRFDSEWAPVISLLTAGPPVRRLQELTALIDAGIVEVCPPGSSVSDTGHSWTISSPSCPKFHREIDHLIDARIPKTAFPSDGPCLISRITERGILRIWEKHDSQTYRPGGVDLDDRFRAVGKNGYIHSDLYVIGIPTEGRKWFTQVGSARPGAWGDFTRDAETVAQSLLARARILSEAQLLPQRVLKK